MGMLDEGLGTQVVVGDDAVYPLLIFVGLLGGGAWRCGHGFGVSRFRFPL